MPVTIADLWLIKRVDQPVDIRSPIYGSRQIDREVARANEECRGAVRGLDRGKFGRCYAGLRRSGVKGVVGDGGGTEPLKFGAGEFESPMPEVPRSIYPRVAECAVGMMWKVILSIFFGCLHYALSPVYTLNVDAPDVFLGCAHSD